MRLEFFLLEFLFLRLFFLENLVCLLMVLGIMLVLSFLVFLFLSLISKSIKNGGTSGAVRVSSGSSTGPEAGEVHHAALACHRYPGRSCSRPSFRDMDDASSDGTNGSDLDFIET